MLASAFASTYAVLVLLGTLPTEQAEQNTVGVYTHVFAVSFVLDLLEEFYSTITFAILLSRTDKRVSALHVTVFAAVNNMTSFIHKTYLFYLVENFGIFYPQIAITAATLGLMLLYRKSFLGLKDVPKQGWFISDEILKKKKQV